MIQNKLREKIQEISESRNETLSLTLEFEVAKNYANFKRISEDLKFVKESALLLKKIEEDKSKTISQEQRLIRQGLFFSLIFIYAKCFTDSSRSKNTGKLEKRDHLKGASEEILKTHDELMDIRHNYLAHGVDNSHEEIITKLHFFTTENKKEVMTKLGYEGLRSFTSSSEQINRIMKLVDLVIINLNKKMSKLNKAVMKIIMEKPIEYWIAKAQEEKNKG